LVKLLHRVLGAHNSTASAAHPGCFSLPAVVGLVPAPVVLPAPAATTTAAGAFLPGGASCKAAATTIHGSAAAPCLFSNMAGVIKTMVSKKKHRYKGDGYNLDLTYITDRLIAMGYPAQKAEAFYRNSMDDVKRFLDEKHKDHYKIYNLCSERFYDPENFHGRVAHYPFNDHHPPPFDLISQFCQDVAHWLEEDQANVAVVHCKAGKGRTGVMICSFLLHSKVCGTAEKVLEYYGKQRTQNAKGVTIPSQRRYINYYDVSLRHSLQYSSVKMYLRTVVVDYVPSLGTSDTYYLQFEVHSPTIRKEAFVSPWYPVKAKDRLVKLEWKGHPLLVADDVRIEFNAKPYKVGPSKKEFHFWLNTFFFDKDFSDSHLAHEVVITQRNASQPVTTNPNQPPSYNPTTSKALWQQQQRQLLLARDKESSSSSAAATATTVTAVSSPITAAVVAQPTDGGGSSSSSTLYNQEDDDVTRSESEPEQTVKFSDSSSSSSSSVVVSAAAPTSSATLPPPLQLLQPLTTSAATAESRKSSDEFSHFNSAPATANVVCPLGGATSSQQTQFPSFSPERHVSGPGAVQTTVSGSSSVAAATPAAAAAMDDGSDGNINKSDGCVTTTDSSSSGSSAATTAMESLGLRSSLGKNHETSISDDTLLSRRGVNPAASAGAGSGSGHHHHTGHVTFQEPSATADDPTTMSDKYYCGSEDDDDELEGGAPGAAAAADGYCASTGNVSSRANSTTHTSFIVERQRHSSVPQSASRQVAGSHLMAAKTEGTVAAAAGAGGMSGTSPYNKFHLSRDQTFTNSSSSSSKTQQDIRIDGHIISLKLDKQLIDKACKAKGIDPNFGVTLYLIKPDNQSELIDHHSSATSSQQQNSYNSKTPLSSQSSGDSATTTGSNGSGGGGGGGGGGHHHHAHQPLINSASTAFIQARPGGGGHRTGAGRLFPPVTAKEQTSSSPESSSEEESCCGGQHGSSTEGQLLSSSKAKKTNKVETTTGTSRVVYGQTSINIHDHNRRHRHHTKNATPTSSSPLAKTDVKAAVQAAAAAAAAASSSASANGRTVKNGGGASRVGPVAAPFQSLAKRSNSNVEARSSAGTAVMSSTPPTPPCRPSGSNTTSTNAAAAAAAQWT